MKTKPWKNTTPRVATFVTLLNSRMGTIGNLANLVVSHQANRPKVTMPKTIRQMTVAEPQGNSLDDRCPRCLDIQEEQQNEESETIERQVDVETPSPGHGLCECTSDDWTDSACDGPDGPDHTVEWASVSEREEVTNGDVDQNDQPTSSNTLYCSRRDQHSDAVRQRSDE
ncbi:hypothetical protein KC323_g247 [Hortaea werneckii]|nr:hypothetical protein KC323_g247 [Hortaea werneckii]KAI7360308.1 hypothetical protein KC320_g194 [Hortaea werneckii]